MFSKIMKYLNIIALILYFIIILGCNKQKTELHYINLYSTTIVAIKCENLKNHTQLKNVTLSHDENEKLLQLFSALKPLSENQTIDARLFGTFYQNSKRIDICMSINIIEINGKQFSVNNKLRDFIKLVTEKNNFTVKY